MTFNELQQEVYRRLNKATASPDTATATRIKSFLNGRMRELLGTLVELDRAVKRHGFIEASFA